MGGGGGGRCMGVRVYECVVIIKRPGIPHYAVNGRSRNYIYY